MDIDDDLLREIETEALRLAREAGEIALRYFRHPLVVEYKGKDERNPVTVADREVEAHLRSGIARRFPEHAVLGEEQEAKALAESDFLWVLDPIDGTANFANGLPFFGISIGVLYRLMPVVGCIYFPPGDLAPAVPWWNQEAASAHATPGEKGGTKPEALNRGAPSQGAVFHARRGGGAFLDGQRLTMPLAEMPRGSRLSGLPAHFAWRYRFATPLAKRLGEVRSLGSITYEMALVVLGAFQYAVFGAPKIWDVAAGIVLVSEAGGLVLYRERPRQSWQRFQRFARPVDRQGKPTHLAGWTAPMVIGPPAVTHFLVGHLRERHHPVVRLVGYLRWLKRRWRGGPKTPR